MTNYIGHARKDYDGKAGDSSGKEIAKTSFTYSKNSTSVYNWTYIFRPKKNTEKMASMMEKAIANNNIGYCSNGETEYGKKKAMTKLAEEVNYDLSKIKVKCGCSCGDIVCLCSRYAGLSACYIGSAVPFAKAFKKNSNYITYKYGSVTLKRGDILVTAHSNGKNNHVVMYLGSSKPSPSNYNGTFPTLPKRGYFVKGDKGVNVKRVQFFLKWYGYSQTTGGTYGDKTIENVKKFQKAMKIKPDGEWGKDTLAKAKAVKK